jgi:NAD(P)-dependent dehydrogenase (short-subunit alcohol dehydrogenase family)
MFTSGRVRGEVAVVTGAALGIGRACAVLLAEQGASVAVTDVLDNEGNQVVREIRDAGGKAEFWHLDVSNEAEVSSVMTAVYETFGPVSVLVNNAGIAGVNKPTHQITVEEWDRLMDVNVKGVFLCSKYVLPQMMGLRHGSIINLSSIYGLIGAGDVPPYHASKGAVRLLSKNDALIYAPYGIRVNSVHPGFIWTPMVNGFAESIGDVETVKKGLEALHPLGHIGEPNDIAYGVLYLASQESSFVTGTELVIDGGYTAR